MQPEHRHMSQADLARTLGVSRAAVSQWKSKDILRDDAFIGPGKTGKIIYAVAVEQVRRNRDIGQSLGNGIATRTAVDDAAQVQTAPEAPAAKPDTVEDQLKRAKLEEQLRRNRLQASEEALRQGMLMDADDAREQIARIAGMMLQIFEGSLPDLAAAVAAQFNAPQRDVLHLLRSEFKKVRKTAAMKERARADDVKKEATTSVELDA